MLLKYTILSYCQKIGLQKLSMKYQGERLLSYLLKFQKRNHLSLNLSEINQLYILNQIRQNFFLNFNSFVIITFFLK